MRRLIFITTLDLGRSPWAELAPSALARNGWEVTIVGPNANRSIMERLLPYPCRRKNLRAAKSGRFALECAIFRWLQHARTGPYDAIYLHSQPVGARASLELAGPLFGKRLVYHTFDFYDPVTYPLHARLEALTARRSSYFLNGEYHRAYFCRTLYKLRCPILVAPPNLPAGWPIPDRSKQIREELGAKGPHDVLLMLHGEPSLLRSTDALFAALATLPPRFRLVTTAELTASFKAQLERMNLDDRVICLGHLDYEKLFTYTASTDIGIMLHANTDLGNFFQGPGRLTEYLACGLPILASHYTALQLLTLKYNLGLCVDPRSPDQIAAGLLQMERSLWAGALTHSAIREAFLRFFAFDHWEAAICHAFNSLSDPHPSLSYAPPDFGALGAPVFTVPLPSATRSSEG